MSGHSKWATIKHKKAKTDSARGKVFTKIIKEITTAARIGGGDPAGNPRLRLGIDKAKEANMPNDNIKRAIQKATGGADGAQIEEITYEGYGPGGCAVIMEVMTDNRNRTLGEIQFILSRNGGNLGKPGSVAWMFAKKGILSYSDPKRDEDQITSVAIEAGADDITSSEHGLDVITAPDHFETVRDALNAKGVVVKSAEVILPSLEDVFIARLRNIDNHEPRD